MMIPTNIIGPQKEEYFFKNLHLYKDVLSRSRDIRPPPNLIGMNIEASRQALYPYTDMEILVAYDLPLDGNYDRSSLIAIAAAQGRKGETRWFFRDTRCAELDRTIVVTGETLAETLKDKDPDDPIIAFGTVYGYRCFLTAELEATFRLDKERGFLFEAPDWTKGKEYPREFTLDEIRDLLPLLRFDPRHWNIFADLINKINEGIAWNNDALRRIMQFRQHYQGLPPDQQLLVRKYIAWLFLIGMWLRFWRGPGHRFPERWMEGRIGDELCERQIRDENVKRQFNERTNIILAMPNPGKLPQGQLEQWVLSWPRIRYNFNNDQATVGIEKIDFIVQKTQEGKFCVAEASEHFLSTGYFYAINVLGLDIKGFNQWLKSPEILNRPDQPDFDPTRVTRTGHTDPQFELREEK